MKSSTMAVHAGRLMVVLSLSLVVHSLPQRNPVTPAPSSRKPVVSTESSEWNNTLTTTLPPAVTEELLETEPESKRKVDKQKPGLNSTKDDSSNELTVQDILSCNFDQYTCFFNMQGQFQWVHTDARSNNFPYRPGTDHTSGTDTGKFMIASMSPTLTTGSAATMGSQFVFTGGTNNLCLFFEMYSSGSIPGYLSVDIQTASSGTPSQIWRRQGLLNGVWEQKMVSVSVQNYAIRVFFTAETNTGSDAVIAVDDVRLTRGNCAAPQSCSWSRWGACSATCGTGVQQSIQSCQGRVQHKDRACKMADCGWTTWREWGGCSSNCDGTRQRFRYCIRNPCPGSYHMTEKCGSCANSWGTWTQWGSCSVTCGYGSSSRSRNCQGNACQGAASEQRICFMGTCATVCQWSNWGSCNATCGGGHKRRQQSCGTNMSVTLETCNSSPCGWGEWQTWSRCSKTCSGGVRQRHRICLQNPCTGSRTSSSSCGSGLCLGPWSHWTTCSKTCGDGLKERSRTCTGEICTGLTFEKVGCKNSDCPSRPTCDGNPKMLPSSSGTLYSPGYQQSQNYTNNLNCSWIISVTSSEVVELEFVDFATEKGYDFLYVHDGGTKSSALLHKLSGDKTGTPLTPVTTSGYSAFLHFTSDAFVTDRGFKIRYRAAGQSSIWKEWLPWGSCTVTCGNGKKTRTRTCNGNSCIGQSSETKDCSLTACPPPLTCDKQPRMHSGSNGLVYSPGYLDHRNYSSNLDCSWIVTVSSPQIVELELMDFATEKGYDFLYIHDGGTKSSALLHKLSGDKAGIPSTPVKTSGNRAFLHFTSDQYVNDRGFKIRYRAGQNSIWTAWSSWGPCSVTCGDGRKTRTRTCKGNGCVGRTTDAMTCSMPDCPPPITCPSHPQLLPGTSGTLYSPGYLQGQNYTSNLNCSWAISVTSSEVVQLEFVDFATERGYDFLYVHDGGIKSSAVLHKLSGGKAETPSTPVTTSGYGAFLHFTSDALVNDRGFKITYRGIVSQTSSWGPWLSWGSCSVTCGSGRKARTRTCNGNGCVGRSTDTKDCSMPTCNTATACEGQAKRMTGSNGIVSTPGFELGNHYTGNMDCAWIITVSVSKKIQLEILDFETEASYDILYVYDGPTNSSSLLVQYSGNATGSRFRTSGSSALLHFKSDALLHKKGFKIEYRAVDGGAPNSGSWLPWGACSVSCGSGTKTRSRLCPRSGCDGPSTGTAVCVLPACGPSNVCSGQTQPLGGDSGYVYSPGYQQGQPYGNNLDCKWLITVTSSKVIELTFEDFMTEARYDSLAIYDGSATSSRVIGSFSGIQTRNSKKSSGSTVLLHFTTDSRNTYRGFKLSYQAKGSSNDCRGIQTLTRSTGYIRSPGYQSGSNYPPDLDCKWIVNVTKNKIIELKFVHFSSQSGVDELFVRKGSSETSLLVDVYSGDKSGTSVSIYSSVAFLNFKSDSSVSDRGFEIQFTEVDGMWP